MFDMSHGTQVNYTADDLHFFLVGEVERKRRQRRYSYELIFNHGVPHIGHSARTWILGLALRPP